LGKLAQTPCLLEPYRNPVTIEGIIACLSNCLLCGNNYKEKLTAINNPY